MIDANDTSKRGHMRHLTVIATGMIPGGTTSLSEDGLHIELHENVRDADCVEATGEVWLFIDWLLPEISGLELCRRIRGNARLQHSHITILLDADDEDDKRRAIKAGADDYILKPISRQKLIERIAGSRGTGATSGSSLAAGPLKLDLDGYLDHLAAIGYGGRVALEYTPSGASADSFGWLARERR